MSEYVYQEYPKALYHVDGSTCVAIDPEDEQSRGNGWYDSPAAIPVKKKGGASANSERLDQAEPA